MPHQVLEQKKLAFDVEDEWLRVDGTMGKLAFDGVAMGDGMAVDDDVVLDRFMSRTPVLIQA